jgi:hypothetical protein
MITLLVEVLVVCLVFGLLYWLFTSIIPLPPPMKTVATVAIVVIFVIILCVLLLGMVGVGPGLSGLARR